MCGSGLRGSHLGRARALDREQRPSDADPKSVIQIISSASALVSAPVGHPSRAESREPVERARRRAYTAEVRHRREREDRL